MKVVRLVGMMLAVYIRKKLLKGKHVRQVASDMVGTGIMGMMVRDVIICKAFCSSTCTV